MVSQWPPVFPTWLNLVQFDIQPILILPYFIEGAPQNERTGGGYALHTVQCTGSDSIKVTTQLKTAENIGKHLKSSDLILRTTEDPS